MWDKFLVYLADLDLIIPDVEGLLRKVKESLTNAKFSDFWKKDHSNIKTKISLAEMNPYERLWRSLPATSA